jgi:asparagine synthase (glutamine-hydrolysing)
MISFARRMPPALRKPVGTAMGFLSEDSWAKAYRASSRLVPGLATQRLPGEKARKLGNLLRADGDVDMYRSLLSAWQQPDTLLAGGMPAADDPYCTAFGRMDPAMPFLDRAMLSDQMLYLPDDLLAKVDRMSMAVSLEARVPLLDHRVVEYSWRLRPEHKIRDGRGKWILRQVLYRRVPPELVDRPKVGFTVPIADWLTGELREWAEATLNPSRIRTDGLLNPDRVSRAWNGFLNGNKGMGAGLWALLMLNAWVGRWRTS